MEGRVCILIIGSSMILDERRSILVQDIRELTSTIFPKLVEIYNELSHQGMISVTIVQLYFWMMCELTTELYAYQIRGHNSKDPCFKIPFDIIKNKWISENFSLENLFQFYVKGPAIYVNCHDTDVSLSGNCSDIIFTFYWNEMDYLKLKNKQHH